MTDALPPPAPDDNAPALVDLLRRLLDVSNARTPHLWNGSCPENENDHRERDSACPACAVLNEARAFLAGWAYADSWTA